MFTYFTSFGKQPSLGVLLKSDPENIRKLTRKRLCGVLYLSCEDAGLKPCNGFIKKNSATAVFMMDFQKIFRTAFIQIQTRIVGFLQSENQRMGGKMKILSISKISANLKKPTKYQSNTKTDLDGGFYNFNLTLRNY